MPGRKSEVYNGSYIRQEQAYRVAVSAADPTVEADAGGDPIPIINLDLNMDQEIRDPGANANPVYTAAAHGHDAVLGIFAAFSIAGTAATLQLWRRLDDALGEIPETWCLVQANNITGNTVLRIGDLIAGKYRVIVSALAAGNVSLAVAQTT